VNRMVQVGLDGAQFIVANTDIQALNGNAAPIKLQIGSKLTKGLGAGADPNVTRTAALEAPDEIIPAPAGPDMVFATPGLGAATADDVLIQAIQGLSDLIVVPGLINLDFADVKTSMAGMGLAMMGTGVGEGQDRANEAARRAISSPLLEGASVNGARGVIINVTGGSDLSLVEVSEASSIVQEAADEDANIIFGAVVDPALKGRVKITVIATGFGPQTAVLPASTMISPAQTPIDMTQYDDLARLRPGGPAGVGRPCPGPRL